MKTLTVRNVVLGEGRPKIIVPIVGETREEILAAVDAMRVAPHEMVEWRIDFYKDVMNYTALAATLKDLRVALGNMPLLVTFRTSKEGGARDIAPDAYADLNKKLAATGDVDLLDVEIFTGEELVKDLIASVHRYGVKIVASNHEFKITPPAEEILRRLRYMQDMDADVLKIAVMPNSNRDVLELLSATEDMVQNYADRPVLSMSMSGPGIMSRICGESFGSCASFGCVGKASAPGQLAATDLYTILETLHRSLGN